MVYMLCLACPLMSYLLYCLSQGGTPTVLSMLYSAIIGQNDGTEEECSNCGTTGIQLRKCSKCKVVRMLVKLTQQSCSSVVFIATVGYVL